MAATLTAPMRALVDGPNPAILATLNPDGSPQTSVVWVGRDGDDLLVSSTDGLRKVRNLRRDPRASLLVVDRGDARHYRYLEVRGTVTVAEDAGRALAVRLAEEYEGPGAGQEYLDLPPEVVRVVLRLTPERLNYRDFS